MKLTIRMITFTVVIGLFQSQALAARQTTDEFLSLSLQELVNTEIIGSTLTPQNLKSVPSSVTVFSYEQINRMGLDTLDELMNLVPGFQSYRSSTSQLDAPFSSRGRRIGTASAEVLVLLDGQRLNDARTSGIAIAVPKFSLRQIERVEFIRGPGSSVYGSNAMMGVVNIISRKNVNELNLASGSFDRTKGHLLVSHTADDFSLDFFGHIDTDNGDSFKLWDASGLRWENTDDPRGIEEFNVKLQRLNTFVGIQYSRYEAENFISFNGPGDGINYRESKSSSVSIRQNFNWSNVSSYIWLGYSASSIEVISQATADSALINISTPASTAPLITKSTSDKFNETHFLFANDWDTGINSSMQFGMELRHLDVPKFITRFNYDIDAFQARDFPITWYEGAFSASRITQSASRRDIAGVYGQYQYKFLNTAELTLGLRHDTFSSIGSQLSPRAGLVLPVGENQSVKLLYGEAYRAPSEEELNLAPNSSFAGNIDLNPETVRTAELIWSGQWLHSSISLGVFENVFENAIVLLPNDTGSLEYVNLSKNEHSHGTELEVNHELNEQWLLRMTASHLIDKPADSFREANNMASISINYRWHRWNANISAVHHGSRETLTPTAETLKLKSYNQVFAKLQYVIDANWKLNLQIKNALDKNYLTPAPGTFLATGVPDRGREILFGVNWTF